MVRVVSLSSSSRGITVTTNRLSAEEMFGDSDNTDLERYLEEELSVTIVPVRVSVGRSLTRKKGVN